MSSCSSEYLVRSQFKQLFLGDIFRLYQTLTAEKTMNLTLPEWTEKVYPEPITSIAAKQCEMENHNDVLKKLNGGINEVK